MQPDRTAELKALLEQRIPVSYTHLDVYKRQQYEYERKRKGRRGNESDEGYH